MRNLAGLASSSVFGMLAVVALAYASVGLTLGPTLLAGLLWVVLTFSAVIGIPRLFLLEDEQQTLDLLRLWSDPRIIFWGKYLFSCIVLGGQSLLLTLLFLFLMKASVPLPLLLFTSIFLGVLTLASVILLCSALATSGNNKQTFSASLALPLLLPLILLAVASSRVALGDGILETGLKALLGLGGYALVTAALSPSLYAIIWKD